MSNYQSTLDFLYTQLPMYQRQGAPAMKKDLSNTLVLCESLGNPEKKFKSIHAAGTNGKGSVCHLMASVLQEAGYKVGLYTSPHLLDFRERIKINGSMIAEDEVIDFVERFKALELEIEPSFFELTVAMAFDHFAKYEVDIAVIETGLGGRLDSTNVITPELSIITTMGLDHQAMLGDTLEAIAAEKAGIIKQQIPVVVGEGMDTKAEAAIRKKAIEMHAPIRYVGDYRLPTPKSALMGAFQSGNEDTAYFSLTLLAEQGWNIHRDNIQAGFKNVIKNTLLRGRWEQLAEHPKTITDGGHNEDGVRAIVAELAKSEYSHLHIVLGSVNDKDLNSILPLWPKDATYYFAKPNIPRGLDAQDLQAQALQHDMNGEVYTSVRKAIKAAQEGAKTEDLIFIGGSLFVVAEVLEYFDSIA